LRAYWKSRWKTIVLATKSRRRINFKIGEQRFLSVTNVGGRLTNRWSERVQDKVQSSGRSVRAAQLNR
jgi:hypothetical protein